MKTESTEALRAMANDLKYNTGLIHSNIQLLIEESFISGVKYGQSSPKIKPLEWDFYGLYYVVKTPVGHYTIRQDIDKSLEDDNTCTLSYNGSSMAELNSVDEAKAAAQSDFEKRVKECLG